jgi:shikimate kinase
MNILLIGFRGTGKTAVARIVARELGWQAIDADEELERCAGKTIVQIFADDGEPAFRDLECKVLADLAALDAHVISLGGGVVLRPENRSLIQQAGAVIWLTASPETCLARIAADGSTAARRPNLTAGGGLEEIRALLAQREPLYRDCANLVINTDGKSTTDVATELLAAVKSHLGRNA